jgi:hypothetical protein
MNKPAELSFFQVAVVIARAQAAPILAKVACKEAPEIDYEGRGLNFEDVVERREYERKQWRDEP